MQEVTVVLPCLNEEVTLGYCIDEIRNVFGDDVEIVVADNGSADSSAKIAAEKRAKVVSVPEKGYGNALIAGIRSSSGIYIVVADCDGSYLFSEGRKMIELLKAGSDLVVGNRFKGDIEKGAMPFFHKIGSPLLSKTAAFASGCGIGDFHCGLRAFRKDAFDSIDVSCKGMEFATEMIVKFYEHGFRVTEMPATLRKDKRNRRPHLRTFRDGARHLLFIIKYFIKKMKGEII